MVAPASIALLYPALLTALVNQNYTIIPDDGVGDLHLVKIDETPITQAEIQEVEDDLKYTTFTLYTSQNGYTGQALKLNDHASLRNSNFNANKQTVFITHGWNTDCGQDACTLVRNAYLKAVDYNVVLFDWSKISLNKNYNSVAKAVPTVAQYYAKFLNFMRTSGNMLSSRTTLVGHSLGAHVSSLAAKIVSQSSRVANVFALDPAGPGFYNKGADDRVHKSHANHVQILHTSEGVLGLIAKDGTSDFVINGGVTQTGCKITDMPRCSHRRAYDYFSESVTNPRGFPGKSKSGSLAYMGGPVPHSIASGTYYLKTNKQSPFAKGMEGVTTFIGEQDV